MKLSSLTPLSNWSHACRNFSLCSYLSRYKSGTTSNLLLAVVQSNEVHCPEQVETVISQFTIEIFCSLQTIKDGSLFGGLSILVLIDVGILTSWQLIDPVLCSRDSDQFSTLESLDENGCTSEHYSIWMVVILVYKYILLIMCSYIG